MAEMQELEFAAQSSHLRYAPDGSSVNPVDSTFGGVKRLAPGALRAALVSNHVLPDRQANVAAIVRWTRVAAQAGADLVLFPEAATTGLINNGDPAHDLPLGEPIPGPTTRRLGTLARKLDVWLGIGLLERAGDTLYDSAVLLAPTGEVALLYRRIDPHWHGRRADPAIYKQGTELPLARTPWGTMAFLICGDLFDDTILRRLRDAQPHWLLYPFARCFNGGSWAQSKWDAEEEPHYLQRVGEAGCTALMANYLATPDLEGGSFGGAWVVSGKGEIVARQPLGQAGILLVDLEAPVESMSPE